MKTLQLSTIVLLLSSAFYSCTKDISQESLSTVPGTQAAKSTITLSSNAPLLTPTQTIDPDNGMVTVTYTATDRGSGAPVTCGKITIYQWKNNAWEQVAVGAASAVTTDPFAVESTELCAYKFRAGFAPGAGNLGTNCQGTYVEFNYLDESQEDFCVNTVDCVTDFTIDGDATAISLGEGMYEFTITYTLTSPFDVENIKFQGGATAGGQDKHELTDEGDMTVVHHNKQNTVLKWEGPLTACEPKVLTFKYKRRFSCPATDAIVTGDWTAKEGDVQHGESVHVTYSCQ